MISFRPAHTCFGLEAVGARIEHPFDLRSDDPLPDDLPLGAVWRGIGTDLAPLLGHEAPPARLPVQGVLP